MRVVIELWRKGCVRKGVVTLLGDNMRRMREGDRAVRIQVDLHGCTAWSYKRFESKFIGEVPINSVPFFYLFVLGSVLLQSTV